MKFNALFIGKRRGSIGVEQLFRSSVEAENEEAAQLKLYERYDHIRSLQLSPANYEYGPITVCSMAPMMGNEGKVYTCDDLDCPIHGSRNRELFEIQT